jgi:hypothetical protein
MALDARDRENFVHTWGAILMKSWEDEDFKQRLHNDPKSVLAEEGIEVAPDAQVVIETPPADAGPDLDKQISLFEEGQSSGTYVFYVQESNQLETQEISEKELEGVAAGSCSSSIISCCCCCN